MRCRKCREDKEPKEFRIIDHRFVIRAKVCRQCEGTPTNSQKQLDSLNEEWEKHLAANQNTPIKQVGRAGVEPTRSFGQRILSPSRFLLTVSTVENRPVLKVSSGYSANSA